MLSTFSSRCRALCFPYKREIEKIRFYRAATSKAEPLRVHRRLTPVQHHPMNESSLHFRTKEHLAKELAQTHRLTIEKQCSTRANPEAPANFPYWSCTNKKIETDWLVGWNDVQMEFAVRGVGKFDLALLGKSKSNKPTVAAAVEVLVTSPMTQSKLKRLHEKRIPWVEVQAHVDFFRSLRASDARPQGVPAPPQAWRHDQPLPVIGSSDGAWTCDVCKEVAKFNANTIELTRLVAIVDVYCSATTVKQKSQFKRKVFGIFKQTLPHKWPETPKPPHFFLVVGTAETTATKYGLDALPLDSQLLCSTHHLEKPTSEPPMTLFEQKFNEELDRELSRDAGAIFDIRQGWPGCTLPEFYRATGDPMASMVNIGGIQSLGQMQASLSRLLGYRFKFDANTGTWIPTRNHHKPVL